MDFAIHDRPATRLLFARNFSGLALGPWARALLAVLCAVVALALRAAGAAAPSEDQVKAAFLLNFPKYVEWPAEAFADERSPIVLAVIGDKGVEKEVRSMAQGKFFNGRTVEVRAAAASDEIAPDCHIVFISRADERKAAQVIAGLDERSVLTVGESDEFLASGGMIELTRRDQKVRLAVNLPAAEARGLKISSKLLSVADVVKRREEAKL
jgi:hypothetical protein